MIRACLVSLIALSACAPPEEEEPVDLVFTYDPTAENAVPLPRNNKPPEVVYTSVIGTGIDGGSAWWITVEVTDPNGHEDIEDVSVFFVDERTSPEERVLSVGLTFEVDYDAWIANVASELDARDHYRIDVVAHDYSRESGTKSTSPGIF